MEKPSKCKFCGGELNRIDNTHYECNDCDTPYFLENNLVDSVRPKVLQKNILQEEQIRLEKENEWLQQQIQLQNLQLQQMKQQEPQAATSYIFAKSIKQKPKKTIWAMSVFILLIAVFAVIAATNNFFGLFDNGNPSEPFIHQKQNFAEINQGSFGGTYEIEFIDVSHFFLYEQTYDYNYIIIKVTNVDCTNNTIGGLMLLTQYFSLTFPNKTTFDTDYIHPITEEPMYQDESKFGLKIISKGYSREFMLRTKIAKNTTIGEYDFVLTYKNKRI